MPGSLEGGKQFQQQAGGNKAGGLEVCVCVCPSSLSPELLCSSRGRHAEK